MAASTSRPIAFITGANKGIGLAVANILASQHGYHVIVGSRNAEAGEKVAASLRAAGHAASSVQLDLASEPSINAAIRAIDRDFGHLDVLINNAGIFIDPVPGIDRPTPGPYELFSSTFATNVIGPAVLTEGLLPLLRKAEARPARIVFVSSRLGSLYHASSEENKFPDWKAYDASKAAVDMLTIQYARVLKPLGIKVNAVCPGLVSTDMTAKTEAGVSPEVGATSTVRMATLGEDGPTGTFTDRDGPVEW
ncbi:putative Short chain dehydrogenase family protein [Pleurostoma richardsiae]|uniref:Short chain dehydrogenase family protein n=1 Tax=Pleurostoma richardsiae TaxID=41990 RepID=A0AA38VJV7_9PEZI|nr:putative Short chain dehydrogenase family protein [Pleurostoma richardsiae]